MELRSLLVTRHDPSTFPKIGIKIATNFGTAQNARKILRKELKLSEKINNPSLHQMASSSIMAPLTFGDNSSSSDSDDSASDNDSSIDDDPEEVGNKLKRVKAAGPVAASLASDSLYYMKEILQNTIP